MEKDSIRACVIGDQQAVTVPPSRVSKAGGFEPVPDLEVICPAQAVEIGTHILKLRAQIADEAE